MTLQSDALAVLNAINAMRLKRHHLVSTSEGVEIHQPGKPVLILTHQAARDFANAVAEAEG